MTMNGFNRRSTLKAGLFTLIASQGSTDEHRPHGSDSSRLVAFVSRTGNTRVLADALSRQYGADAFEIRPRDPWPEDYEEMVAWATDIRESDINLPLEAGRGSLDRYRTVFLGFPVWGMAMPGVMTSFLKQYDLSGKTIVPFITHGGYGAGNSLETLSKLQPNADILAPFILECDQERETLNRLSKWTSRIEASL